MSDSRWVITLVSRGRRLSTLPCVTGSCGALVVEIPGNYVGTGSGALDTLVKYRIGLGWESS